MKKKSVKIQLTDEQLEKLQPLFDQAAKYPMEGVILGQPTYKAGYPDNGTFAVFQWIKLDELISRIQKTIEKATGK